MMQHLSVELRRAVLLLLLALVCGLATGGLAWWLVGALAVFVIPHLYNLARLNQWLTAGRKEELPDAEGLWGDVFTRLHHRERRVNERRRRLSRLLEQFQKATQAHPDGVVILGAAGEIEAFNNAGRDLLGLRRPEDHGRPVTNFLRMPEVGAFLESSDPEETLLIDSPVRQNRSLLLQIVPYARDGQRLLITRDVTRLERLERIRQDFVANVSHELRSPLTVIKGYAENLDELERAGNFADADDSSRAMLSRSIDQIQKESERMRLLVEDLLELSRLEATDDDADNQVVNVDSMIKLIVDEALALGEGRHRIELDVDNTLGVEGNEREIYTAFSNVVFNAIRYMSEPGVVRISWQLHNERPRLVVSDEGPGIPADAIPRLTERFYRVDDGRARDDGGTGLGLAIAKHVMLRHEGKIEIESTIDVGTTVKLTFARTLTRRVGESVVNLPRASQNDR